MRLANGFSPPVSGAFSPAITEIEQPPLNAPACLEVAVQAVLPKSRRRALTRSGRPPPVAVSSAPGRMA